MADPTDTSTPDPQQLADVATATSQVADATRNLADVQNYAKEQFSSMERVIDNTYGAFNSLTDSYTRAAAGIKEGIFQDDQARNIGLVTTALLGARDAFTQFGAAAVSIQKSPFMGPIEEMQNALAQGGGLLQGVGDKVLSVFGSIMPESAKKGAAAMVEFAKNLLVSSGNAIYMRDAVLGLAGATGNLNNIYNAAGTNLENINEIMAKQSIAVQKTAETMNISREQAMKYYLELGKVPGVFGESVSASTELIRGMGDAVDSNSAKIDMFTATVAAARGMNRELSDVVGDLTVAFKDYGLTGEAALNFSERMSDVSGNLGIDLASVKNALSSSADIFKEFADAGEASARMTEGLAEVTNRYAMSLKEQGLSGNVALDVAKNMVGTISQMGIAQKAFLSAQTGGPGGLMGAFQLEKDLRSGKVEEVFKKVRDQMKKQLGSIVTLDEASASPAAAAQLARQMAILQKGPLGGMAKTDQEAYRILEAFKGGDQKIKALAPDALKGSMDKGVILQDQTRTIMSGIRSLTERQVALTEMTNLILVQNLTAATGARRGPDEGWQERMRSAMVSQRSMAASDAQAVNTSAGQDIKNKSVDLNRNAVNEDMAKGAGEVINMFSTGKEAMASAAQNAVTSVVKKLEEKLAKTPDFDKWKVQKELDKYQSVHAGDLDNAANPLRQEAYRASNSAGSQLGDTVNTLTSTPGLGLGTQSGPSAEGPADKMNVNQSPLTGGKLGSIDVNVTGYCIRCKQEIEGGSQVSAISPPARRT
jgi:hypothetical protein